MLIAQARRQNPFFPQMYRVFDVQRLALDMAFAVGVRRVDGACRGQQAILRVGRVKAADVSTLQEIPVGFATCFIVDTRDQVVVDTVPGPAANPVQGQVSVLPVGAHIAPKTPGQLASGGAIFAGVGLVIVVVVIHPTRCQTYP